VIPDGAISQITSTDFPSVCQNAADSLLCRIDSLSRYLIEPSESSDLAEAALAPVQAEVAITIATRNPVCHNKIAEGNASWIQSSTPAR
jgi:hypothetical protein